MKLAEKTPIAETTITNSIGLFRKGNRENPSASARIEIVRILLALPVLSSKPPHNGDSIIVSTAGIRETVPISEYDAPSDLKCIGRKVQIIPIGPNARPVDICTPNLCFNYNSSGYSNQRNTILPTILSS
jgi:hypothetical protein